MACEVPWLHLGVATTRPKTGDLRCSPAYGAGVDVMVLLKMFGNLLMLDSNVHRAVFPFAWVHYDLGAIMAQDVLVDQDEVDPVFKLLLEHVMDHGKFWAFWRLGAVCVHIRILEELIRVLEELVCVFSGCFNRITYFSITCYSHISQLVKWYHGNQRTT